MLEDRVFKLNSYPKNEKGKYVLYCMESSQRIDYNYALIFAINLANQKNKPLLVLFNITDKYKFSNSRYYKFMLEGIIKLKKFFDELGIKFFIRYGDYVSGCLEFGKNAVSVVLDTNYLSTQRKWREIVSSSLNVEVFEVESDVVIPIRVLSDKQLPYAYLVRNRVYELLDRFLVSIDIPYVRVKSSNMDFGEEFYFDSVERYLEVLNIDKSVEGVKNYIGGCDEANRLLREFLENKIMYYAMYRSDPTVDYQSNLSPYLHFGQISPVYIIKEILKRYTLEDENVKSFFNELVVWRELARNFCYYNPNYNNFSGIPDWAKKTLNDHINDKREFVYTIEEFENAKTHDEYWNSAQVELLKTGKMHNYMRMYWAKKILEWSNTPQEAFDIACYLNDKYEIDGRDPNGYAGISWCFGSFDRPFQERKVIGQIRYMSAKGLESKFDIKKYVEKVRKL